MDDPTPAAPSISARLRGLSSALKDIEVDMIAGGDIDHRVLLEFREAVNHIRHSAWAVQQWLELREKHKDPFEVLVMLVAERVRIGTQLCHELALDAESSELTFQTPGLDRLCHEADRLVGHIKPLVRRPSPPAAP
jgi:hypothetical protein